MRMYELWRMGKAGEFAARLEDQCGPVLFPCRREAEEYSRKEAELWEDTFIILEVRVGMA